MKRIYWRPNRVSQLELVLVSALAVGGLIAVERFLVSEKQPAYETKLVAAKIAKRAFEQIHLERIRLQVPIDPEIDPAMSGIIGLPMSPIVSNTGSLPAKQTSVNPNFAAVVVDMLDRAGVKQGDPIAIGTSGSFPALNTCVYAAAEALNLAPVAIASVAASQYGASHPQLTWLDMERVLREQSITRIRSIAASRGGIHDRGDDHTEEGKLLLDEAIARSGIPKLDPATHEEAVSMRIEAFAGALKSGRYAAYINVGGGTASVGTTEGKKKFKPGLNLRPPRNAVMPSVMRHFASQGIPVIHLVQVDQLAERYGLPLHPTHTPEPGAGNVYFREVYNPWLVWGVLLAILASLYATVRMDLGFRVLKGGSRKGPAKPPEQMV